MPGRSARHHRWSGKKLLSGHGYVKVRVGRAHPLADPNGYAYEHLVVWVAAGNERPARGWVLHHRNGVKTDNRIENLEVVGRGAHNAHHNEERGRNELGQFVGKKRAGRLLDGRTWDEVPRG